ncbi:DNA-dependent RNA polymerase subunit Rpb9 [Indivirus ILV1]|uniref:DNA-dependent RNA polymerase subunit Rpb9 n=1 Tax=Indivirus ILV1 TaxID=1977633 RepID=A0A1V0SCY4_9VIRU|nr:DNA-dependent RNA polymerase subunit Rpb9 [Indivirus ILV1]
MYFCPNCNNIFDITKNPHGDKQSGGSKNYLTVINNIINDEEVTESDTKDITLTELINEPHYKKLSSDKKELVYNKLQQLLPVDKKEVEANAGTLSQDKAYFICKNCGFLKPIEENTLIFSRVSNDISQSYTSSDVSDMANSDILPRTRKYICSNKKCVSNSDPSKKEAIFFRVNNSYNIRYVCLACKKN